MQAPEINEEELRSLFREVFEKIMGLAVPNDKINDVRFGKNTRNIPRSIFLRFTSIKIKFNVMRQNKFEKP